MKVTEGIIAVALLIVIVQLATFLLWWQEIVRVESLSTPFRIFVWSLVASNIFLLVTRAYREWSTEHRLRDLELHAFQRSTVDGETIIVRGRDR
jgi:hypothetical protein